MNICGHSVEDVMCKYELDFYNYFWENSRDGWESSKNKRERERGGTQTSTSTLRPNILIEAFVVCFTKAAGYTPHHHTHTFPCFLSLSLLCVMVSLDHLSPPFENVGVFSCRSVLLTPNPALRNHTEFQTVVPQQNHYTHTAWMWKFCCCWCSSSASWRTLRLKVRRRLSEGCRSGGFWITFGFFICLQFCSNQSLEGIPENSM